MPNESTTEPALSTEISATAYRRATKLLWFDIIVTFGILTAVASRL
ncbi:MAG: hypothetical protein Q7J25_13955 [Vicinamibacterales bacterium]|nr:hypothetical protein [Vicinamibacterales bacterium]